MLSFLRKELCVAIYNPGVVMTLRDKTADDSSCNLALTTLHTFCSSTPPTLRLYFCYIFIQLLLFALVSHQRL